MGTRLAVIPLSTSTMSAVAPSRLAALKQLQCSIFQTSYNPASIRTGAKYLRARLRGPSMVQYYPTEISIARLARNPRRGIVNLDEEQRLRDVEDKKKRGKGAPRKAKTKGVSLASPICCIEIVSLTIISPLRGESAVDPETMNSCIYHTYTLSPGHARFVPNAYSNFQHNQRIRIVALFPAKPCVRWNDRFLSLRPPAYLSTITVSSQPERCQ